MDILQTRKNSYNTEELQDLSKEDLIEIIKGMQSHNTQLKNIINKSTPHQKQCKKSGKAFDFTKCRFRHVLLHLVYLGWDYQGFVTQEDTTNTVEYYLFEALMKTCLIKGRNSSNYHRCGRTDKGVSSFGQVISIDLRSKLLDDNDGNLDEEINYCYVLNKVLPDTIQCIAWCPVPSDFSARFKCKSRTYKYFLPKAKLNIEKMRTASTFLLGIHDFRNFCKMDVGNGVVKFVRNITSISIIPFNDTREDEYSMYVVTITGQAFLWHQIRCIMSVLLLIGQEKETPDIVKQLLDVEKTPRKPDYNLASEIPLNLYCCDYDIEIDKWKYDTACLINVMQKLFAMWTFTSVKSTMMEQMSRDLYNVYSKINERGEEDFFINCLLNGVKPRKYIPLMKRPTCESLENRINHYIKRQKLEIVQKVGEDEKPEDRFLR